MIKEVKDLRVGSYVLYNSKVKRLDVHSLSQVLEDDTGYKEIPICKSFHEENHHMYELEGLTHNLRLWTKASSLNVLKDCSIIQSFGFSFKYVNQLQNFIWNVFNKEPVFSFSYLTTKEEFLEAFRTHKEEIIHLSEAKIKEGYNRLQLVVEDGVSIIGLHEQSKSLGYFFCAPDMEYDVKELLKLYINLKIKNLEQ